MRHTLSAKPSVRGKDAGKHGFHAQPERQSADILRNPIGTNVGLRVLTDTGKARHGELKQQIRLRQQLQRNQPLDNETMLEKYSLKR